MGVVDTRNVWSDGVQRWTSVDFSLLFYLDVQYIDKETFSGPDLDSLTVAESRLKLVEGSKPP